MAASRPAWLEAVFPFLAWWPRVNRETLKHDAMAAFTGAVVVLPQGVAFAVIAGMPPEYGLYTAMIPAIIAALFGSSWHLVSGPTTAASLVLFASLSSLAEPGTEQYVLYALTLTFMVGVTQLLMGVAKLGTLVNFISHSVVIGFTAGAAILIAFNQIKNFFGVDIPRGLHFYEIITHFVGQLDKINPYVTAVGVATLVSGILVRRFAPKVPYMIVAMLVGSVVALVLDLVVGREVTQIKTVGALPASLPGLSSPDFSLSTIKALAPAVLAVTLLALTEAVSIARSIAVRSGQHVDGNQEFIGQGLSNMFGSFFSAYVATGSFNRSGVNFQSGAKTPLAAVIAGVLLMGLVLLVAPYAAYLPNAAMGGILFLVAWGLIDFEHIGHIIKSSRAEAAVMGTTFFSALFLDLEMAILLGVILSLVLYLNRTSKPRVTAKLPHEGSERRTMTAVAPDAGCPQLAIVSIDGSLFFGATASVKDALADIDRALPGRHHLLLLAHGINFLDLAGAEFLAREAKERRARGGALYLAHMKPGAAEMLERSGLIEEIGHENVFASKTKALEGIYARLDPAVCAGCTVRAFRECGDRAAVPSQETVLRRVG